MPVTATERTFTTAREFLDHLIHEVPSGAIYRGHSNETWGLIPSAWRPRTLDRLRERMRRTLGDQWCYQFPISDRAPATLAERYCGDTTADSITRIQDLAIWLASEQRLVDSFASKCDRVGLTLPAVDLAQIRSRMTEAKAIWPQAGAKAAPFVREVPVFLPSPFLAMAQHLGLPTRLLDFSDNPLKAAFFSANPPLGLLQAARDTHVAVWLLQEPAIDVDVREIFIAGDSTSQFRVLRSQVPYLHAQDGLFITCNESSNRFFLEKGRWPNFLEVMHGWRAEKLRLPASETMALLNRLAALGIDESTMMPSFDRIARVLIDQMEFG